MSFTKYADLLCVSCLYCSTTHTTAGSTLLQTKPWCLKSVGASASFHLTLLTKLLQGFISEMTKVMNSFGKMWNFQFFVHCILIWFPLLVLASSLSNIYVAIPVLHSYVSIQEMFTFQRCVSTNVQKGCNSLWDPLVFNFMYN